MKVKDLVPVVINKVQLLYYCAEDGLFPVYKKIGEACYLADMPDELLELEVGLVSVSETLSLDIRVFYTDKDNFAERFEALAQKFADINEAMTKPDKGESEVMLGNSCGTCAAAVSIDGKQDVVGCKKYMDLHSTEERNECFCMEHSTGATEDWRKEADHEAG